MYIINIIGIVSKKMKSHFLCIRIEGKKKKKIQFDIYILKICYLW